MARSFKMPSAYMISRCLVYVTVIFLAGLFVYWAAGMVSPVIQLMF